MIVLFVPMLVLPSRVESVYWYIPMIGLTFAFAVLAGNVPRWAVAIFFLFWLPLNYYELRPKRSEMLAHGDEARWYVNGLLECKKQMPPLRAIVFQFTPPFMGAWGIEGALHQVFGLSVDLAWYRDEKAKKLMSEVPMALIGYYPLSHTVRGRLRLRDEMESYISMNEEPPMSQIGDGWLNADSQFSWIQPKAEITLRRPEGSREFELVASLPSGVFKNEGPSRITILEDGRSLGVQQLSDAGKQPQPLRWKLPGGEAGIHRLTIVSEPARRLPGNPNQIGVAVRALGYVSP
jgi:hypothetical protein